MKNIIKYINLDVSTNKHVVVKVNQYDIQIRDIYAKVVEDGKPYDITNVIPRFKCKKNDGTIIVDDNCSVLANGDVHIKVSEQITACDGTHNCQLLLISLSNEQALHTMKFQIVVDKAVFSDNEVTSSNEFIALENALLKADKYESAVLDIETAEEERVKAEEDRQIAEQVRQTNETKRESAEAIRQTDTATAISSADTATSNANIATEDAKDATEAAIEATANTNTAIQNANTVVEEMKALIANDNIIHSDDLGVAGGVATLDENGFIPASQLPGFVDDVVDGSYDLENDQFIDLKGNALIPESGKIYVDTEARVTYRWSGSTYVDIGSSLAIGETSASAFSGDRGLTLEKKVQAIEEYHNNIPASDIKFDNTNTPLLGATVQEALEDLTNEATHTSAGLMSAEDKKVVDNYKNIEEIEITLLSTGWGGSEVPYTQTVAVTGLSTYNNCSVTISSTATVEQTNALTFAKIENITYDENSGLIFSAYGDKPDVDIPLIVCVANSMNVVEVPHYLGKDVNSADGVIYNNETSGLSSKTVQSAIDEQTTLINGKAPISHADTALTYGGGTASNYGHVKLSDNYTTSDGAADASVGASSKALSVAYNEINSNLPKLINIRYMLEEITWVESYGGLYYVYIDLSSQGVGKVLSVTPGNWSGLRPEDSVIFGIVSGARIMITANTNVHSVGAWICANIAYV